MRYIIPALLITIAIFVIALYLNINYNKKFIAIPIRGPTIKAEVADSPLRRGIGLMFRKHLDKNGGMLFNFTRSGKHAFWMAYTYIPLDIIWINSNYKVVHINENTPSCAHGVGGSCPYYKPAIEAKYVLEVNAGFVNKHGIKVGDKVFVGLLE